VANDNRKNSGFKNEKLKWKQNNNEKVHRVAELNLGCKPGITARAICSQSANQRMVGTLLSIKRLHHAG
jgi:hypothetical protein